MRALALLLLPSLAWAQAVRYNDPPPTVARPALATRIDELVARVAKRERRLEPRPDARLDAAATELVRVGPESGVSPNELVQGALWLQGIVEPSPQLMLTAMDPGGEDEMLRVIGHDLPPVLAKGRFGRVGVGLGAARGGETRVIVLLQESFVDLDPIARAQPLGGNVLLRGRLHEGFQRPEAFVTAPDGTVSSRVNLGGDPVRFGGTFRCGPQKGRYQVEVAGETRLGATVVANFPIWCGVPPPMSALAAAPAGASGDDRFTTAPAAEQTIWKLLNADRAHAGLPALAWDAQLATVARAHSGDMQAHGFVGHVSPSTGSSFDRARKANIDTMLILENVARAISPGEAERGLMNSPGHRANILSKEATRVGVGVVEDPASHEILVTQFFSRPSQRFDAHSADELRRGLVDARRAHRLRPLESNPQLDELAQSTAKLIAERAISTVDAKKRLESTFTAEGPWSGAHTMFAVAPTAAQAIEPMGNAIGDASVTHVGVGVAPGKTKEGDSALFVVIVLATHR